MDRHPHDTDVDLPVQPPLAACPFCGAQPTLLPALHHGYFVACENPHCFVSPETTFDADTIELAAERWNQRPVAQVA